MANIVSQIQSYIPHGYCLSWDPTLLGMHVVSDALTALSYFTIPVMLMSLVRQRKDLKFSWLFVLFGLFILACGATHIMSIWNLWFPDYVAAGVLKVITAVASVGTAIAMVKLVPVLVALPGAAQWEAIHQDLKRQVEERELVEMQMHILNSELEERVQARTAEMAEANARLQQLHEELEARVAERTQALLEAQGSAHALANQAVDVADRGSQLMQNVEGTMSGISTSSAKMEEAVGVIHAIAFQTNILALNAAVEAARAGEQGRGFAIVANEVRNLSRRSADAAKDIKSLIDTSVDCVQRGAQQVGKAGETMKDIVKAIGRVNDIVADLSSAGRPAASGAGG